MPQLKIKSGMDRGKVFEVSEDSNKIGRDPSCRVPLNESGVSREHAEIYRVGEMFFIRDLGSRNGIMVNDMNVEDELLRDGDIIRVCSYVLVFESIASTADGHQEHFYDEQDPGETMVMTFDEHDISGGGSNMSTKASMRIGQLVRETSRMDNLLEGALDVIFDCAEVMEVFIFVLEPGQRLAQKAYRKLDSAEKGKASRSIVLRALKDKTTIVTANAMDDFRFKAESSISLKNINSVLCCPLSAMGQEVGVIYLNNGPKQGPFSQDMAEMIQRIATHLALAVQNIELKKSETEITDRSVKLIADAVESSLPQLKGRGKRVASMANTMGKVLGLKRPQLVSLHIASYLHHAGYAEYSKKHDVTYNDLKSETSYVSKTMDFLRSHQCFEDAQNAIEFHRFRLDGAGTPSKLDVSAWSVESQILAWCVELDIRLSLPLSFGLEPDSISDVAEQMIKEGTTMVTRPIVTIFEKAWKKGLILI